MNRRRALLTLALTLGACAKQTVPMPDLTLVEDDVRQKVLASRQAVLDHPSAATWALYGRVLHAHRMLEDAETAYLAAATAVGSRSPAAFEHLHLAGCAALEGHMQRSLGHFGKALAIRDDYLPAHLNLATVAERLGQTATARKHYEFVATNAKSSHAHLGLGRLALRAGDAAGAVEHLRRALAANADHKEVYEVLARAHARLQQMDESRAAAAKAGDLAITTPFVDPLIGKVDAEAVDVRSRMRRGARHANAGKLAEAIEEFERIVAVRPRHITARYYLAAVLYEKKDLARARQQLDRILSQDPKHEKALELRARIEQDEDGDK